VTDAGDIALLRVVAQRLAGAQLGTAAEAVRWLTAVQAQDLPGALCSVALRVEARSRGLVVGAMNTGQIVRSWPMRGTLHLVAAEDLEWMLTLLTPRVVTGSVGRRTGLGLSQAQLERARETAFSALSGGEQLSRSELFHVWDEAGLSTQGQRGAHMLSFLAMTGTLVFGPMREREQLLVLAEEWIPSPRRLERDEALGELALRYFRSHGPATVADLVRWAQLLVTDARTGVAVAGDDLVTMEVDGIDYLLDPRLPDRLAKVRADAERVLLLPGFDEFVLGYKDRSAQLDPAFADRIVPGGNGMFRPTVVSGGRVLGTWSRTNHGREQSVAATPFSTFPAEVAAALPGVFQALP
jgi:hypothetical protein